MISWIMTKDAGQVVNLTKGPSGQPQWNEEEIRRAMQMSGGNAWGFVSRQGEIIYGALLYKDVKNYIDVIMFYANNDTAIRELTDKMLGPTILNTKRNKIYIRIHENQPNHYRILNILTKEYGFSTGMSGDEIVAEYPAQEAGTRQSSFKDFINASSQQTNDDTHEP